MADVSVTPVPRGFRFHVPRDKIHSWHPHGLHVTAFMNSLSIFFPEGERFFIESLRAYKDDIPKGSVLAEQYKAFVGQESFHSREHEDYNAALASGGVPLAFLEGTVGGLLAFFLNHTPRWLCLAGTVALEHLTAVLGHTLLTHQEQLKGADRRMATLWLWHAIEETEHKAVSFDVFNHVLLSPGSASSLPAFLRPAVCYVLRFLGFAISNILFWPLLHVAFCATLYAAGGITALLNPVGWLRLFWYQWGPNGALRAVAREFISFFRPSFHPWNHDNRELLGQIDELTAEIEALEAEKRD